MLSVWTSLCAMDFSSLSDSPSAVRRSILECPLALWSRFLGSMSFHHLLGGYLISADHSL